MGQVSTDHSVAIRRSQWSHWVYRHPECAQDKEGTHGLLVDPNACGHCNQCHGTGPYWSDPPMVRAAVTSPVVRGVELMTLNHAPQTFEEWRESALASGQAIGFASAFAAGVASQQAEIERLKAALAVDYRDAPHLQIKLALAEKRLGTERDAIARVQRALLSAARRRDELEGLYTNAPIKLTRYEAVVEAARALLDEVDFPGADGIVDGPEADILRAALAALESK